MSCPGILEVSTLEVAMEFGSGPRILEVSTLEVAIERKLICVATLASWVLCLCLPVRGSEDLKPVQKYFHLNILIIKLRNQNLIFRMQNVRNPKYTVRSSMKNSRKDT